MGGKSSAPPPPDYTEIAAASAEAARYQFELGKEQLSWAREQYADNKVLADKIVSSSLARQAQNDSAALEDRRRYTEIYQPLEDAAVRDAQDYSSEERQRYDMGRAEAAVGVQFDAQRDAALKNLEGFGVDPSSTRYAALDANMRIQEAAAKAGAANNARTQTEAVGRALRSEGINVGRGYPGQVAGTYATALQSGNSAINSGLGATASGAQTMGTPSQYFSQQGQALGTWGNTLHMGYQDQLAEFQANQQASSGLGALGGALLGAVGNAGGVSAFFEDGGAVPTAIPTGNPGSAVPTRASPSGGAAVDDVNARLTAGEFVIPTDAVSWLGEKHFQQLISKSREEKAKATAKPQFAIAPMGQPTYSSRQPAAIPAR